MAMGRNHGVVSREVSRNREKKRYRAKEAQEKADARKKKARRQKKLDKDDVLRTYVETQLREGWSPEKIAGRTIRGLAPGKTTISHESIYDWIYHESGRYGGLSSCLWTRRKGRYVRKGRKPRTPFIQGKTPVTERPIDNLPGHLESDSMIWASGKGLLSAQICRTLKICRLTWCENRGAEETYHAITRAVETLPHRFVRSIAFDNGGENASHLDIRNDYGAKTYFCAPHSPWQKPQIENLNRTIRHWYPRKTKAQDLADLDWKRVEDRLNNTPRKSLGYLTPNEALHQYLAGGAFKT